MEARLTRIRAKEKAQRDKYLKGHLNAKKRKTESESLENNFDEDEFVLDEYDSDQEQHGTKDEGSVYSAKTLELMEKLGMRSSIAKDDDEDIEEETKVSNTATLTEIISQSIDLLLLENPFTAYPVHQRAPPCQLSACNLRRQP